MAAAPCYTLLLPPFSLGALCYPQGLGPHPGHMEGAKHALLATQHPCLGYDSSSEVGGGLALGSEVCVAAAASADLVVGGRWEFCASGKWAVKCQKIGSGIPMAIVWGMVSWGLCAWLQSMRLRTGARASAKWKVVA